MKDLFPVIYESHFRYFRRSRYLLFPLWSLSMWRPSTRIHVDVNNGGRDLFHAAHARMMELEIPSRETISPRGLWVSKRSKAHTLRRKTHANAIVILTSSFVQRVDCWRNLERSCAFVGPVIPYSLMPHTNALSLAKRPYDIVLYWPFKAPNPLYSFILFRAPTKVLAKIYTRCECRKVLSHCVVVLSPFSCFVEKEVRNKGPG